MGLILDLLTLPVLGAPKMVHWLAETLLEEAQRESLDEGPVRHELMELQERYDMGQAGEEEYQRQEKILLERLAAIRQSKAE